MCCFGPESNNRCTHWTNRNTLGTTGICQTPKKAHSPLPFALPTHDSSSHRAGIKGGTFHQCWEGILRYMRDPREIQGINEQPPLIPRCSHISPGTDSTESDNFMHQGHLSKGEATQGLFQLLESKKKREKEKEHLKGMKPQKHKL